MTNLPFARALESACTALVLLPGVLLGVVLFVAQSI